MQFELDRLALLAACQVADAAAADRALAAPILTCIKVVADADRIVVMGTDSELGVRYEVPASDAAESPTRVAKPGAAVFPPDKLLPILRHDGAARVAVREAKGVVQVKTALGRFDFTIQDVAQFPDVAATEEPHGGRVAAAELVRMLERVAPAVSKGDATARWTVMGFFWEIKGGALTVAGTDTRRMAIAATTVEGEHKPASAILPRKAMSVLLKAIAAVKPENVTFEIQGQQARFGVGPVVIHSKLLEGRFPPFREIMPKRFPVKLSLPRPEFAEAVRQAAIMTDGESIRVDLRFTANAIDFAARTELGRSDLRLPIEGGPDKPVEFGVNPRNLLDGLEACDGPTLDCGIVDGTKPVVFKDGPNFTYFTMPMVE